MSVDDDIKRVPTATPTSEDEKVNHLAKVVPVGDVDRAEDLIAAECEYT